MEIKSQSKIEIKVALVLTEVEARALNAITEYGTKSFLEVFYKTLGKNALEPYEKGIESLFETIKAELPKHLTRVDKARKTFNE